DERVANLRQGPFSPILCDEHRVAVDPADGLLSVRKSETGRDEGVGVLVELSDAYGVLTAIRKMDEAQALFGRQAPSTFKDPVFLISDRQRVNIDDGLPVRVLAAIAVKRSTPPDA